MPFNPVSWLHNAINFYPSFMMNGRLGADKKNHLACCRRNLTRCHVMLPYTYNPT